MITTQTANRTRRLAAAAGVVIPVLAILAVPAAAQPLEQAHYSDSASWIWEDYCHVDGRSELTVQYDQQFEGNFLLKARGPDGLVYGHDLSRFTTVRTNLTNGKTVTTDGVENHHDQTVIDNDDGTLTVREAVTLSQRSYDSSGRILDHAAGRAVFEYLIDDNGTPTDPYDDEFLEFVGFAKEFVGQPGISNWCEVVHDALE
jgi:hypothetical protein